MAYFCYFPTVNFKDFFSKKQDVSNLEQEVDVLRRKLDVQEKEFRLQQSTLMEELNRVI